MYFSRHSYCTDTYHYNDNYNHHNDNNYYNNHNNYNDDNYNDNAAHDAQTSRHTAAGHGCPSTARRPRLSRQIC
jgi:hypothetical protein